jgi:hypothetical protein
MSEPGEAGSRNHDVRLSVLTLSLTTPPAGRHGSDSGKFVAGRGPGRGRPGPAQATSTEASDQVAGHGDGGA